MNIDQSSNFENRIINIEEKIIELTSLIENISECLQTLTLNNAKLCEKIEGKNHIQLEKKTTFFSNKDTNIYYTYHKNTVLVYGNTFDNKEKIKEIGGIWNKGLKGWIIDKDQETNLKDSIPGIKEKSKI